MPEMRLIREGKFMVLFIEFDQAKIHDLDGESGRSPV
jgi:hypothetical protein